MTKKSQNNWALYRIVWIRAKTNPTFSYQTRTHEFSHNRATLDLECLQMTMNKQSILKNRKQIERYIGLFGSEQGQTQHILTKRAVVNFTENWALLECLQMKMNKQSTPKKSHSWSKGRGRKKVTLSWNLLYSGAPTNEGDCIPYWERRRMFRDNCHHFMALSTTRDDPSTLQMTQELQAL